MKLKKIFKKNSFEETLSKRIWTKNEQRFNFQNVSPIHELN